MCVIQKPQSDNEHRLNKNKVDVQQQQKVEEQRQPVRNGSRPADLADKRLPNGAAESNNVMEKVQQVDNQQVDINKHVDKELNRHTGDDDDGGKLRDSQKEPVKPQVNQNPPPVPRAVNRSLPSSNVLQQDIKHADRVVL